MYPHEAWQQKPPVHIDKLLDTLRACSHRHDRRDLHQDNEDDLERYQPKALKEKVAFTVLSLVVMNVGQVTIDPNSSFVGVPTMTFFSPVR
jgi:hypothetical protein